MSAYKIVSLFILAIMGMIIAFQLPYHFPPADQVLSASYDYGFSNKVGILCLGLFSVFFLIAGFKISPQLRQRNFLDTSDVQTDAVGASEVMWLTGISLLTVLFVSFISPDFGFSESTQFISAMERLSLKQKPYADFDFYYGPLLAYGPFAIYKIGSFLANFNFKFGYFVFLFVSQIAGLIELRFILNSLRIENSYRKIIFWMFALATLPLHSGINLILFRYLTPLVGFIWLKRNEGRAAWMYGCFVAFFSLFTFGISIEYGVVFLVASIVYSAGAYFFEKKLVFILGLICHGLGAGIAYMVFPGMFDTVQLYLRGAWQWPFIPSIELVLFFFSIFSLAFFVGVNFRELRKNYFFLCACLLALGSIPAALGRCDPAHVVLNGAVIFLLAFIYLSAYVRPLYAKIFGVLWMVTFVLLMNMSLVLITRGTYLALIFRQTSQYFSDAQIDSLLNLGVRYGGLNPAKIREKLKDRSNADGNEFLKQFDGYTKIAVPYAPTLEVARFLRRSEKLDYLYFKEYGTLASSPEVSFAIRDLEIKQPEFLLLPANWKGVVDAQDEKPTINLLFATKYLREPIRSGRELFQPLVAYISSRYLYEKTLDNFVIMRRNPV